MCGEECVCCEECVCPQPPSLQMIALYQTEPWCVLVAANLFVSSWTFGL